MEIVENLDAPLGNSVFSQGQLNSKNLLELFNQQKAYNSSNLFPFQLHLLSYTAGLVAGQSWCEEKIKVIEKQPIAYLYGEDRVRLPALPEPQGQYAVIYTFRNNGMYYLVFSDTPESVGTDGTCGVFYDYVSAYQAVNGIWETVSLGNTGFRPIWANYDVLYADGSVYLSASDPIPVYEPDEPEKQLIGYSYNGVVLPDINEVWTDELKQQYPYAVIVYAAPYETYAIFISTAPMYVNADNIFACSTDLTASLCTLNSGVWELVETIDFGAEDLTFPMSSLKMTWSSYDVLWDDGSVYSAASDPIPVYNAGQTETVVYDDTWPIEWIPSAMTNNLKYYDIVKVSNLTPTAEKMQSAVLTLENQVFNCTGTNTAMDGVTVYVYTDADGSDIALFVVSDNSLTDTGLYATDLGDNDCKLTLSL